MEALTRDHLDERLAELESSLHKWIVGTGGPSLSASPVLPSQR